MKSVSLTSVLCSGVSHTIPIAAKAIKVANSSARSCNNKTDMHQNKLQSYKIRNYSAQQVNDTIELTLNIQMLECTKANKNYAFLEKNIFDLFSYKNIKNEEVLVETKSANIVYYKNGKYTKLNEIQISDGDELSKVKATFNIRDILTNKELDLYDLGAGVEFDTSIDFNLSRRVLISSSSNSDLFDQSYGGFRIQMKVK